MPAQPLHAGIGAPYTHATAPLRRLVDRYVSEICLAHAAGRAGAGLGAHRAARSARRDGSVRISSAHAVDRAVVDATEAWLLRDRVGERFARSSSTRTRTPRRSCSTTPPVRARCAGEDLPEGQQIEVVLEAADVQARTVRFVAESAQQVTGEHGDGGAAQRDP